MSYYIDYHSSDSAANTAFAERSIPTGRCSTAAYPLGMNTTDVYVASLRVSEKRGKTFSPFLKLPAELKQAIFERFENYNDYAGIAEACRETYEITHDTPSLHWQQNLLKKQLAEAPDEQAFSSVIYNYRKAVCSMPTPIRLPEDSSQELIDGVHKLIEGTKQRAEIIYANRDDLWASKIFPSTVRAYLDVAYLTEENAIQFVKSSQKAAKEGLYGIYLDALQIKSALSDKTSLRFQDSLKGIHLSENGLEDTVFALPGGLLHLELTQNQLTSERISRWRFPEGLLSLDLSENPLDTIPNNLPKSLHGLSLRATSVKPLNDSLANLPLGLRELMLGSNGICSEDQDILRRRLPNTRISFED